MMTDHVSGGMRGMANEMRRASTEASSLKGTLGSLAGLFGAGFGLHEFKKHFVDFNSEMEQAKLTTAGFMAMSGLGTFNEQLGVADDLVKQYTIDARASIGTTADFVEMSKTITASVTGAGGSIKDLHDMTKGLVISGKASGMDPHDIAIQVEEALNGMLSVRQRFTKRMLGSIGYKGEEGAAKWKELSQYQRLMELKRSLGADWLKDMASAQEHSMEGARTTFIDNAQLAAMRAGKALFEGIKVELNKWNEYLIRNGDTIDHIADVVGHKLLQGAISFKNAIQWAAEHWKTIAASYAAMKAAGFLAGAGGGVAGLAGGASGGGIGFGGKVAAVSLVASAVYIGGQALADFINESHEAKIERAAATGKGTMDAVLTAAAGLHSPDFDSAAKDTRLLRQQLTSSGLASASGGLNKEAFIQAMKESGSSAGRWADILGIKGTGGLGSNGNTLDQVADSIARAFDNSIMKWNMNTAPWRMEGVRDAPTPDGTGKKGDIKVTIQRLEVLSDDPDRFAFGLDELVKTAAQRGGLSSGQAAAAMARGMGG